MGELTQQDMKTKALFTEHKKELKDYIVDTNCSWKQFCQMCKEEYNINKNYATDLWMQCWTELEEQIQKHDLIKGQTLINRLEDIYLNTDDENIQLKVIEQLRKIGGVDASDKIDMNIKGDIQLSWGTDEH